MEKFLDSSFKSFFCVKARNCYSVLVCRKMFLMTSRMANCLIALFQRKSVVKQRIASKIRRHRKYCSSQATTLLTKHGWPRMERDLSCLAQTCTMLDAVCCVHCVRLGRVNASDYNKQTRMQAFYTFGELLN